MTVLARHPGPVSALAITPDGNQIISAGDNSVRLWDRRAGQPDNVRAVHEGVRAVAVTPDGQQIISGRRAGWMVAWRLVVT